MQNSTSKNETLCGGGCCSAAGCESRGSEPGFFAKRPWIWIIAAFAIMFTAWGVMFTMAYRHQPKPVPMVNGGE